MTFAKHAKSKEKTEMYLDTQELPRVDRVANDTIRAQAQTLVALTDEVDRLLAVIEEMRDNHGEA